MSYPEAAVPRPVAASISPAYVVVLILGAILVGGGWLGAIKAWRGALNFSPRNSWPRSRQEDMIRRTPTATVGLTFMLIALLLNAIWGHHASGARIAELATALIGVATAVLSMSVGLLGRPQWAIPPHLRRDPHSRRELR